MQEFMQQLLTAAIEHKASDIYITHNCPPCLRIQGNISPLGNQPMTDDMIMQLMTELVSQEKLDEFDATLEMNTALQWENKGRFRINAFRQQEHPAIVLRRIETHIPSIDQLQLPESFKKSALEKRGLVLVVGPTGSGKSTSLAAMIHHRNLTGRGHIITIEDPIEFVHQHQGCIISQRDVGLDTYSFAMALKNALRQAPDVILIGEIRDQETMEHALNFAETGHLVLATLHTNNASQTIERILAFFPEDRHKQILLNLSLNLRSVFAQRLVPNISGTRSLALEVLLNQGLVKNLIEEGNPKGIKEIMERNHDLGMQTFEQALFKLCKDGVITEEAAMKEADNPANLQLQLRSIKLNSGA